MNIAKKLFLVAAVSASAGVFAQQAMPSDAEIRGAIKDFKESAAKAAPGTKAAKLGSAGVVKAPVIPGATPYESAKKDDLNDLVQQFKQGVAPAPKKNEVDLMIFVSFSMPKDVLTELSRQAKEAGAIMVVRGFKDNSLMATQRAALEVNHAKAEWDINPNAFKQFKVKTVPTFVVADASARSVSQEGCSPEVSYGSVSGNISVDIALDTIRRRSQPSVAAMAEVRMKKLAEVRRVAGLR